MQLGLFAQVYLGLVYSLLSLLSRLEGERGSERGGARERERERVKERKRGRNGKRQSYASESATGRMSDM